MARAIPFGRFLLAAAAALATLVGPARAQLPVVISYQPAQYAALPLLVATERGWWAQAGLEPRFLSYSGGPAQIAAAAGRNWDVGVLGAVSTVLGTARAGLVVVAIAHDEAQAHALVIRAEQQAEVVARPQALRGQQLLVSLNTGAEFVALACLRRWNLARADMQFVNLAPSQIITAFAAGSGTLAATWSPFTQTLAERTAVQPVCNGRDAGVALLAGLVVRFDFNRTQPDTVLRLLAVYLRGLAWLQANPQPTIDLMRRFAAESDQPLGDAAIGAELETRQLFGLDDQLRLFTRSGTIPSTFERAYGALATYLRGAAAIREVPAARDIANDEALRRIAGDAALRAFATTP